MGGMNSVEITQLEQLMAEIDLLTHQRLNIKNNDLVGIEILILIQRILNGYKATKFLKKHGFFLEASTLVRSIIESIFVFNGVMDNNPDVTITKMEQMANQNRKKVKETALNYAKWKDHAMEFDFTDLDAQKVYMANLAKLSSKNTELYEVAYTMLCNDVHVNQASLEKFLEIKDDVIVAIKPNLDAKDFDNTYIALFYFLQSVLTDLNQKYSLEIDLQLAVMETILDLVLLIKE